VTDPGRPALAKSLEQLTQSGLIARGVVNTIELSAIEREFGAKWPRRMEQVWGHVENTIRASLGEHTYFLRISDTSYLVCLPELTAITAQTRCAIVLKDLLIFFLGASVQNDIVVRTVTHIAGERITSEPVSLAAMPLEAAGPAELAQPEATPTAAVELPRERQLSSAGGPLVVSFAVENVYRTTDRVLTARRIKANVLDQAHGRPATAHRLENLETAAIVELDHESVKLAAQLLGQEQYERIGLFVPMNLQTLVSSRGRERVLALLEATPAFAQRGFAELVNITPGTPSGRIAEALGVLRTRVRGVYARLSIPVTGAGPLAGAGLNGVLLDTMAWESFDAAMAKGVLAFADVARSVAPVVIAGPLTSEAFIDVCTVAGVTHYTMQQPGSPHEPLRHPHDSLNPSVSDPPFQALFVSCVRFGADEADQRLEEIVKVSAANNAREYVTGFMVLIGGRIVQVLEGERDAVNRVLARVMKDERHEQLQLLRAGPAVEREFPKWSMAGLRVERPELLNFGELPADTSMIEAEQALLVLRAAARVREGLDLVT